MWCYPIILLLLLVLVKCCKYSYLSKCVPMMKLRLQLRVSIPRNVTGVFPGKNTQNQCGKTPIESSILAPAEIDRLTGLPHVHHSIGAGCRLPLPYCWVVDQIYVAKLVTRIQTAQIGARLTETGVKIWLRCGVCELHLLMGAQGG